MSDVFRDPTAGWAALLVVILPLLIIGIGEAEERLRQRDSPLRMEAVSNGANAGSIDHSPHGRSP